MINKKVRVRIAPSPTGDPHVGTAYIALFNYIFAKKNKGKFILRIEDTDRARFNKESENGIIKYLKWLNLSWDEGPDIGGSFGPYRQSERSYGDYADLLIKKKKAYLCFCSEDRLKDLRDRQRNLKLPPGYDGKCRDLSPSEIEKLLSERLPYTIRLKMPKTGKIVFKDLLRGNIEFDATKIDDQILIKADGMPTYHLANVIDDYKMGITHTIRAEEWIPSTPKHIILYEAFGWEAPKWVHMPLLRNSDKSKISKRKNDVSLEYYYEEGYLKEAMLNFLALMGYRPSKEEKFSIKDMIDNFDFSKLHLGSPAFDINKLRWLNREYIKSYSIKDLAKELKRYIKDSSITDIKVYMNLIEELRISSYTLKELADNIIIHLERPYTKFKELDSIYNISNKPEFKDVLNVFMGVIISSEKDPLTLIEMLKKSLDLPSKEIFPAIRIAITSLSKGLELVKILKIYGKEELLLRTRKILELLNA
jgi:glutamyl-tRNA synthetase